MVRNIAEGRGHDKLGTLEIRFLRVGFVEDEVLNEGLDKNIHPALAGGNGLAERFLAAEMDDVSVRAGQRGEGHQVMHAFGFNAGRTTVVVRIGSGPPGGKEFLLQLRDEGLVLAVSGDDDAEFLG